MSDPVLRPSGISCDASYFDPIAGSEDRHFWFRARRKIIATALRSLLAERTSPVRVLEIGCGTGNVTRTLVEVCGADKVTAMEPQEEALIIARQRLRCTVVQGDLTEPPDLGTFPIVGMFDVLEHLRDERAALDVVRGYVEPGGVLLMTVPARQSLWSYFDDVAGHFRRYEIDTLSRALEASGFQVAYATEFFALLFPIMWLGRRMASLRGGKERNKDRVLGELRTTPIVNEALTWVLGREAKSVAARKTQPFGTSILAVARRPL
jgi:SAM-dependent methyltransferase